MTRSFLIMILLLLLLRTYEPLQNLLRPREAHRLTPNSRLQIGVATGIPPGVRPWNALLVWTCLSPREDLPSTEQRRESGFCPRLPHCSLVYAKAFRRTGWERRFFHTGHQREIKSKSMIKKAPKARLLRLLFSSPCTASSLPSLTLSTRPMAPFCGKGRALPRGG